MEFIVGIDGEVLACKQDNSDVSKHRAAVEEGCIAKIEATGVALTLDDFQNVVRANLVELLVRSTTIPLSDDQSTQCSTWKEIVNGSAVEIEVVDFLNKIADFRRTDAIKRAEFGFSQATETNGRIGRDFIRDMRQASVYTLFSFLIGSGRIQLVQEHEFPT